MRKFLFCLMSALLVFSCKAKAAEGNAVPASETDGAKVMHNVEISHFVVDGNKFTLKDKDDKPKQIEVVVPESTGENVAYIIGFESFDQVKHVLKETYGREIDDREIGSFLQGLTDCYVGNEITQEYMMKISDELRADMDKAIEARKAEGEAYFKRLESDSGIKKTGSGLLYEVLEAMPEGEITDSAEVVNVDYIMNVYDPKAENLMKEADKGNGVDFPLAALIMGAKEGIKLMRVGEKYRFYIKPELGYGPNAVSPVIGPNSFLVFDVKVNKIVKYENKEAAPADAAADDSANAAEAQPAEQVN